MSHARMVRPSRRTVLRGICLASTGGLLAGCVERTSSSTRTSPSDPRFVGSPPVEWTRSYDPTAETGTPVGTPDVHVESVTTTADTGYALAGRILRDGEAYDPILLRVDNKGREQWRRSFGGGRADRASMVETTADGGFIIAGDLAAAGQTPPGGPGKTGWVATTDTDGRKRWSTTPAAERRSVVESARPTRDGGVALAGWIDTSAGYAGWFARLDPTGHPVVSRTYDSSNDERSRTGDYHVAELFATVTETDDGGFVLGGRSTRGGWVQKVTRDGEARWQTFFEYPHDIARDVLETANGDLLVTGRLYDRSKDGKYTATGTAYPTDLYLTRLTPSGDERWTRAFDGEANEAGQAVTYTDDDGFLLAGGSRRSGSNSRLAAFLVRTDADGARRWSEVYFTGEQGGPAWDVVRAPDGGYAFAAGEVFAKLADVPAPQETTPPGTTVETYDGTPPGSSDVPVTVTDEVPPSTVLANRTETGTADSSRGE